MAPGVLALAFSVLGLSPLGEAEVTAAVFDSSGSWPECAEGPRAYMEDCIMKSNYLFYAMAMQPTLAPMTSCTLLGYSYVSVDPAFPPSMQLYWKGGESAFEAFTTPYLKTHPLLFPVVNASRDGNPACNRSATKTTIGAPRIVEVGQSRTAGSVHDHVVTAALYDATGRHAECVEGPVEYMEDCVLKSYWYVYFRMEQPTLHQGTCAEMGYDFVSAGPVFSRSNTYWKGGRAAFQVFAGPYFKAHPDMEAMLKKTRDETPACRSTTAQTPAWV
mmetsp:Transcript_25419/g.70805  ORF Transcript_25419/g.70805 Transcript_25419/m.70805 type:complete len:274 (-) Transcript_25419:1-822(-)